MTPLIVTNFNRNFTGVSATAAAVIAKQAEQGALALVGHPLPGCPAPITLAEARARSGPGTIWHVRRNTEMRAALWTRDVLRKPIRIVFTSAAIRRHSALPRWLINRMDSVIATTEAAARFVPHVRGVVPHGVDTDRFTPAPDRAAAWQALGYGGTAGIATIGRVRPEKGTDRFVHAMLELLPERPGLTALVIGKVAREHEGFAGALRRTIAAAGLEDRILWPGEIGPEQMPALMRGLSLVMQLPTYEGYGMVPLEGMASGTPFVATDTGYYAAFASQGRAGLITTPERGAAAATRVLDCADMQQDAREVAEASFSIDREVDGITAVYEKLRAKGSIL
ncbi:MAG: glycosyltransferase family 4 protein [Pseudomonadota bacterium]